MPSRAALVSRTPRAIVAWRPAHASREGVVLGLNDSADEHVAKWGERIRGNAANLRRAGDVGVDLGDAEVLVHREDHEV